MQRRIPAKVTLFVAVALIAAGCLGDPRAKTDAPPTGPAARTPATATTPPGTFTGIPATNPPATSGGTSGPGSTPAPTDPPGPTTPPVEPTLPPYTPPPLSGKLTVWTFAQGEDEVPIKAYLKEFQARYPDVDTKLVVIPEDNYTAKVNTSLQAHNPPDIAIIEDMRWAKSGRVVELTPWLQAWGVPIEDFSPGGIGRMALEADPAKGVYGIGDFLGGYVSVYNKALYTAAGVPEPPADRSLSYDEFAANCRAIGKPASDPAQALYGCAAQDNLYSLRAADVFGADGRTIVGNGNADAMVHAFEVGSSLISDGMAPSGTALDALGGDGESDLFAQGKIAVTGTDFTEVNKYKANGVDFAIVPFYAVYPEKGPLLDTFTAPWGTFTKSSNPDAALEFLRFIATDAQRIRPTITPDPPLRISIAQEVGYGADDPIKQQYLKLLGFAQAQVFVPNGVEAWDPGEVVRQMTVEHKTDARAILDPMVQDAQREVDRVWRDWEELAP
ncbi:MAG: multiple sugar transport system substrate-binding protein [Thermoleophilaceae bacterium]|nr:multiple sugar transport system substrate-binding protein [Thermoleophilaceae bacterium]